MAGGIDFGRADRARLAGLDAARTRPLVPALVSAALPLRLKAGVFVTLAVCGAAGWTLKALGWA